MVDTTIYANRNSSVVFVVTTQELATVKAVKKRT
ncbi:MAG: hypothetical protein EZS28_030118, partial [Streblomastix strix]